MASEIATHEAPVWRQRANFLVFADLSQAGLLRRWEQLWVQQMGESEFIVCCIPYFTYGIALGDMVSTEPSAGRKYVVADMLLRSGRRVLRLWLKNATKEGSDRVLQYLEAQSPLHEWSSDNLLAIDVPGEDSQEISALLADMTSLAIEVEWGN